MKFSATGLLSVGAALISAAAAQAPVGPFYLQANRAGEPFSRDRVSAAYHNLWVDLPFQNATCAGPDRGFASFILEDQRLHLVTFQGEDQLVFVDRSGFGRGTIGFFDRSDQTSPRFETEGWYLDANRDLHFAGLNLDVCPTGPEGSWNLRLHIEGATFPDCVGVRVHAYDDDGAVRCRYN